MRFQDELLAIRKENERLRRSQQDMHADLAELRKVRADIEKLVETACSLKPVPQPSTSSPLIDSSQISLPSHPSPKPAPPGYSLPPPCQEEFSEDEEEWPEPPPWPEPDDQEQAPDEQPTEECLYQAMAELQLKRAQAHPHQPSPVKSGGYPVSRGPPPVMGHRELDEFDWEHHPSRLSTTAQSQHHRGAPTSQLPPPRAQGDT